MTDEEVKALLQRVAALENDVASLKVAVAATTAELAQYKQAQARKTFAEKTGPVVP